MTLATLPRPWAAMSWGFLDASAKREMRRKMVKAIAVPGCQMPYASREVPMARGWGTGGLQVTLTFLRLDAVVTTLRGRVSIAILNSSRAAPSAIWA